MRRQSNTFWYSDSFVVYNSFTDKSLRQFLSHYSRLSNYYLIQLYCWHSTVTNVPRLSRAAPLASIGEWIFICLTWVSRPFWWLLRTAIWIMKVLMGRSWISLRGIQTQPLGSFNSITSTSWRSLKLVPALMDILKIWLHRTLPPNSKKMNWNKM